MAQLCAGATYATRPSFHCNSAISESGECSGPKPSRTNSDCTPLGGGTGGSRCFIEEEQVGGRLCQGTAVSRSHRPGLDWVGVLRPAGAYMLIVPCRVLRELRSHHFSTLLGGQLSGSVSHLPVSGGDLRTRGMRASR